MTQVVIKRGNGRAAKYANKWFLYWLDKKGQYEEESALGDCSSVFENERDALPNLIKKVSAYEYEPDGHMFSSIGYDCGPGWQLYDITYVTAEEHSYYSYATLLVIDDDVEAVEFKLIMG